MSNTYQFDIGYRSGYRAGVGMGVLYGFALIAGGMVAASVFIIVVKGIF